MGDHGGSRSFPVAMWRASRLTFEAGEPQKTARLLSRTVTCGDPGEGYLSTPVPGPLTSPHLLILQRRVSKIFALLQKSDTSLNTVTL
jgi:hypothetical protein